MKKKIILITAMVALLVCVFAISVSAANEVTLVGGEKVDFETVFKVGKSGGVDNVVTGFNTGYNNNSMTDVIFPDYLAGIECNGLFGKYANPASTTIKTLTFESSDEFFISGDNIFSGIPITKVTFNPNCVVEVRKGNFSGCTSLTEITFPKFRKLSSNAFANCSNMVATNSIVFVEGMTEIGGDAFNGCSSLNGTIVFPSTLTTIKDEVFRGTSIEAFDFSKCANLSSISQAAFTQCDSLTTIDMSACVGLTSLSNNFAENCDELISVILPPNLESIPYKAFAHCYKMQSIVLPASLTYVADEAFHTARKNQDIKTFTVYVQGNVVFHEKYSFRDSSAKIEFVLIGNGVTAQSFKAANTYSAITGATVVDYVGGENPWTYVPGQAITSHTIVDNYCKPLALTGEHLSDANPCVINCSSCGLVSAKENPVHTVSSSIAYANGYDNVGVKTIICTNKGCSHKETVEVKELFVCQGYSAPEKGSGGITIGFTINNQAIKEYETSTGKTLKYGAFAVAKSKLGTNDIFSKDGTVADYAITAEIISYEFYSFDLKIVGFTDDYKDTKLALGAYVITTDGKTNEYSYIQEGAPIQNEKYAFISYGEIMNA